MQVKNLPVDPSQRRPSYNSAAALEHLKVEANSNSNSNISNSRGGNIVLGHSPGMLDSGVTHEGHQRKEIKPNFISHSEEVLI